MQMKYTKIDSAPALIILSVLCVSLLNFEQENHTEAVMPTICLMVSSQLNLQKFLKHIKPCEAYCCATVDD